MCSSDLPLLEAQQKGPSQEIHFIPRSVSKLTSLFNANADADIGGKEQTVPGQLGGSWPPRRYPVRLRRRRHSSVEILATRGTDMQYNTVTADFCESVRLPSQDGSFNLVTTVDGKCVHVDGGSQNSQLRFEECDRDDAEQKWRFYDACHPGKSLNITLTRA